ncbi:MAG: type II toxin-antitoxin system RelE/ParE family toxin [Thermomonas sp.]|uniref:type II toxin-antitoxin system RelE/ParE family toxin n=1 Tax=Thermomonas sp. TaxID=1971895 RepID=UPI0039E3DBE1
MKPVEWRPQARRDAAAAAYWYAQQGGLPLGEAFLTEVDTTLDRIAQHPAIGSTRHAEQAPDLPSLLRFLPLRRFEHHLVYYIDLPEHIEVLRIWHAARGLAALMDATMDNDLE